MVHVEAQERNAHSLLAYMKRLLTLRKRYRAFGRGSLTMLEPANHRVLAFVREYEDERLLVVVNLSRFSQAVELDLGAWAGSTPVELFGRTTFWLIDGDPYKLSLGPHAFYWFALRPAPNARLVEESDIDSGRAPVSVIEVDGSWRDLIDGSDRPALEAVLPVFLGRQPWFRGSVDAVLHVSILDAIPLRDGGDREIFLVPTTVCVIRPGRNDVPAGPVPRDRRRRERGSGSGTGCAHPVGRGWRGGAGRRDRVGSRQRSAWLDHA